MEDNRFYTKIQNTFEQYNRHKSVIEEKKKDLEKRKEDIAKLLILSEFEEDVEQTAFEVFTEMTLYENDLRIWGHRLYILVDAYVDADISDPRLSKEVLDTCSALENTLPKNNFSVDKNLVVTEKDKDFLKKVRETQVKSGAMKELIDHLKNVLDK
jgi:hypothetical protein